MLVKKFGGTSLANIKLIKNAACIVKRHFDQGEQVVVVVSAMSGVTNNLFVLSKRVIITRTSDMQTEIDNIVSTGEQVSSSLFALALQNIGLKSRSYNAWQLGMKAVSDDEGARLTTLDISKLNHDLDNKIIPIITGFQGIDNSNRTILLGRGASDYTALFVAAQMKADSCDIYTDVDGVFTADPKIVSTAKKIKFISVDEMYEMAVNGSKVLHPRAVAIARDYNVRTRILSTFSPKQKATTLIKSQDNGKPLLRAIADKTLNNSESKISIIGSNIGEYNIIIEQIKQAIGGYNISLTNESLHKHRISFTIPSVTKNKIIKFLHDKFELNEVE